MRKFLSGIKYFIKYNLLYKIYSKNIFLSSLYYRVFYNKAFSGEQFAVFNGCLKYKLREKENKSEAFLLRNTHRIEKGLIMRPRKKVFGLDYIIDLVKTYKNLRLGKNSCDIFHNNTLNWTHDILSLYFATVDNHPTVVKAKQIFDSVDFKASKPISQVPFTYKDIDKSDMTYEKFQEFASKRKSIRWYENKQIEKDKIDNAIKTAGVSPSACNRQPYHFHIIQNKELILKIAALASGTSGFIDNIPNLAVITGDLSYYPTERDRHVIYIDGSLAAMSFMLALASMNIGSCALNWPENADAERILLKALNIDVYNKCILLISFGYPDPEGQIPYSQKKELDLIRTYY